MDQNEYSKFMKDIIEIIYKDYYTLLQFISLLMGEFLQPQDMRLLNKGIVGNGVYGGNIAFMIIINLNTKDTFARDFLIHYTNNAEYLPFSLLEKYTMIISNKDALESLNRVGYQSCIVCVNNSGIVEIKSLNLKAFKYCFKMYGGDYRILSAVEGIINYYYQYLDKYTDYVSYNI